MDKEVKNRWLSISKCKFNIPKPMDYKDYTVAMYISVESIDRPDNQDGSIDVIFKGKATGEIIVKDEFDKVYIKTDKRSQSQKLRGQIFNEGDDYDETMQVIRHLYNPYIKELIEKYKKGEIE